MTIEALLFDLDGTMLNTDPIHIAVFAEMMKPKGLIVDDAFYLAHVHGRLNTDIFAEFLPEEPDPQALSDAKEAEFRRRLPRPFPAMPGLEALLTHADQKGLKMAVVTNANRLNAEAMLHAIGQRARFNVLVIGEECTRGKPHPDPYAIAMARLGVDPAAAIAFEDSPSGIRSARAAGATVVGIRSSSDHDSLCAAGAHVTLSDFTDPALAPLIGRPEGATQ